MRTRKEAGESLVTTLKTLGVPEEQLSSLPIVVENVPNSNAIFSWMFMLFPILLIFGFFIFIMRQAGGGGQNRAMQFGRRRARKMEAAHRPTVTFEDVAGAEEAKQELESRRISEGTGKIRRVGRTHSQRRADGRRPGPEDPAGQSRVRRGRRALLQHFRLRICGDVCRRRRQSRARPVRSGQKERPLHHLYRRDRRGRSPSRGRLGRRQRRTGADPQPDSGRDGWL